MDISRLFHADDKASSAWPTHPFRMESCLLTYQSPCLD
jgi:hypothetical protein